MQEIWFQTVFYTPIIPLHTSLLFSFAQLVSNPICNQVLDEMGECLKRCENIFRQNGIFSSKALNSLLGEMGLDEMGRSRQNITAPGTFRNLAVGLGLCYLHCLMDIFL